MSDVKRVIEQVSRDRGIEQSVLVKTLEEALKSAARKKFGTRVDIEVQQSVANYLINRKRREITNLEEAYQVTVNIQARSDASPEHLEIRCFDEIGSEVHVLTTDRSQSRR